jgi:hypothetical protein
MNQHLSPLKLSEYPNMTGGKRNHRYISRRKTRRNKTRRQYYGGANLTPVPLKPIPPVEPKAANNNYTNRFVSAANTTQKSLDGVKSIFMGGGKKYRRTHRKHKRRRNLGNKYTYRR